LKPATSADDFKLEWLRRKNQVAHEETVIYLFRKLDNPNWKTEYRKANLKASISAVKNWYFLFVCNMLISMFIMFFHVVVEKEKSRNKSTLVYSINGINLWLN